MQTLREQLLSGTCVVHLAKIVALHQHINVSDELEPVFGADITWYEVPRDTSLDLDCTKVQLPKLLLSRCAIIVNVIPFILCKGTTTESLQVSSPQTDCV